MTPVFKHSPKDLYLVGQTLFILAMTYAMALANLEWFWQLLIAPFHIALLVNSQNSALHHHAHWTTFTKKSLNRIYDLLVSAANANKVQTYRMAHNTHHKYVNDIPVNGVCKDPISVFAKGANGELENVWNFCYRFAVMQIVEPWKYVFFTALKSEKPQLPLHNFTLWRREQYAIVVFLASVLAINFVYGVWLLTIYFVAHFLTFAWHYGDHYGSYQYRGDTTRDSVGIYNKWYNLITANAGYHQEHHHKPHVHWTQIPSITQMLPADRITFNGLHVANVPWLQHLKLLFRP